MYKPNDIVLRELALAVRILANQLYALEKDNGSYSRPRVYEVEQTMTDLLGDREEYERE